MNRVDSMNRGIAGVKALESVEIETLRSEGYSFQVEMSHRACRAGFTIAETPIIFTDRRFGHSKISKAVLIESMFMPWRLRFHPWQPSSRQAALGIGH